MAWRLPSFALVALLVPAFAGCITPAGVDAASLDVPMPGLTVAFDGAGLPVPLPDAFGEGLQVVERLLGHRGGEPNIGVTSTGAIFTTAGHNTLRSRDHGETWEIVFNLTTALPQYECPPGTPAIPLAGCPRLTRSSDPMLWVDPVTDRVFTNHMTGLYCSNMIISDDEGDSWTMKPMTCGTLVNDHQKVATAAYGPKAPKPPVTPYPTVVYYCYNKLVSTQCAVSLDGGFNFAYERTVASGALGDPCGGINGHPAPHPDGTIFVPLNRGCPGPVVGVSEDSGLTWTIREGPTEFGASEIDPDITVTPDGTAYMLWRGSDNIQYLSRSSDKFATWDGPWKVSPEGVTSTVFTAITSGDDGRIAFSFIGTRDSAQDPSDAEDETRWHLFTGFSLDAASENPTFVLQQVSPDADPVQIGCVWLGGGGNPCRNMLDFIDMASDADGRVFVAYTDGCVDECANVPDATNENSRGRHGAVAILVKGPTLRAAAGTL